jgi:hypothetical protein
MVLLLKERILGSGILFGWQQLDVFGELVITFFRGDYTNVTFLVNQILYIAWLWFIDRLRSRVDFSFLDWCNNPLACYHRI